VIDILHGRGENPNIAAAAKEFFLPVQRLLARWNGRKSKQDLTPGNRRLLARVGLSFTSNKSELVHYLRKAVKIKPSL
jgi:hypothetical protein